MNEGKSLASTQADAGLAILVRERPAQPAVTALPGLLEDQAALQGVFDTPFMLNMALLLVER